jgi:hypothetical protein
MNPWGFEMLLFTVVTISVTDILTRYVPPVMVAILLSMTLIGWSFGLWDLSLLGGPVVMIPAWMIRLPLGDVFGLAICGLLTGPLPTMSAFLVCSMALFMFLTLFGHRVSLVRHPFFPYVGAMVLIFSMTFTR